MAHSPTIHPFEAAGLGRAPFRVTRIATLLYQACPGAPVKPGGACDYCSTAIRDAYYVRGADGREFKVGCDCVRKVGRKCADTALLRSLAVAEAPKRREQAARARARRAEREAARRAELSATAETRCAAVLARLDAAGGAFAGMARDVRAGRRAELSPAQLAWLERVESR